MQVKVKDEFVPVKFKDIYIRQWRQNYRNGQRREVNFTFRELYTWGNSFRYPLVGTHRVGLDVFKGKISLPWLESNHDSSSSQSRHYLDWALAVLHSSSRRENKATKKSIRHGLYLRLWQSPVTSHLSRIGWCDFTTLKSALHRPNVESLILQRVLQLPLENSPRYTE